MNVTSPNGPTNTVTLTTSPSMTSSSSSQLPLFGHPGATFYVIHGLSITSASVSWVASGGVGVYLLRHLRNPWSKPIGERLVLYLALCDVMFSTSRGVDHIFLLVNRAHLPDPWCAVDAFVTVTFFYAQMMIVTFTALNAFSMVVMEKRLDLGVYDWRLLASTCGIPAVLSAVGASLGVIGPGPAWCYADIRHPYGWLLAQVLTVINILAFIVDAGAYVFIWVKLRRAGRKLAPTAQDPSGGGKKYHRSARMMLVFVAAYFAQVWPIFLYHIWSFVVVPPAFPAILMMVFVNGGGVFNAFAYTVIRRKYLSVSASSGHTAAPPASGSTRAA